MNITYTINQLLVVEDVIALFNDSDYFPIKDKTDTGRIQKMITNASLVVAAWDNDKLVGIARSLCDYSYCCYLSDICVRNEYKGSGIGQKLMELTKETAGPQCKLILHSNPAAMPFYTRIGMQQIDAAFIIQRDY